MLAAYFSKAKSYDRKCKLYEKVAERILITIWVDFNWELFQHFQSKFCGFFGQILDEFNQVL